MWRLGSPVKSDKPERCGTCSCDSSDGCLSQSSVARLSDSGLLHTNSAWIAMQVCTYTCTYTCRYMHIPVAHEQRMDREGADLSEGLCGSRLRFEGLCGSRLRVEG